MKILINEIEKKDLKAILLERGYSFPCNGKGICGKCRIIASDLQPTSLDKRFLNERELFAGYRLACDKTIDKPLIIDCLLDKKPLAKPLGECDIAIVFNKRNLVLSVYADKIVDVVNIPIEEELDDKNTVISYIAKESIELLEFYKVARATGILISGVKEVIDFFDVSDDTQYNLPCEDVYVLKGIEDFGSNVILELLSRECGLYVIERDGNLYMSLIKENEIPSVVLNDTNIANSILAIKDFMERAEEKAVNFITEMPNEEILKVFEDASFIKPLSEINSVNCLINNRYKALYNKLLRKIVIIDKNYEFV